MAEATVVDRSPREVKREDRRRPGRVDYQDAQLIALLRVKPTSPVIPKLLSVDDLVPARGILIGLPIGAAMWAVISAILYFA